MTTAMAAVSMLMGTGTGCDGGDKHLWNGMTVMVGGGGGDDSDGKDADGDADDEGMNMVIRTGGTEAVGKSFVLHTAKIVPILSIPILGLGNDSLLQWKE